MSLEAANLSIRCGLGEGGFAVLYGWFSGFNFARVVIGPYGGGIRFGVGILVGGWIHFTVEGLARERAVLPSSLGGGLRGCWYASVEVLGTKSGYARLSLGSGLVKSLFLVVGIFSFSLGRRADFEARVAIPRVRVCALGTVVRGIVLCCVSGEWPVSDRVDVLCDGEPSAFHEEGCCKEGFEGEGCEGFFDFRAGYRGPRDGGVRGRGLSFSSSRPWFQVGFDHFLAGLGVRSHVAQAVYVSDAGGNAYVSFTTFEGQCKEGITVSKSVVAVARRCVIRTVVLRGNQGFSVGGNTYLYSQFAFSVGPFVVRLRVARAVCNVLSMVTSGRM